MGREISDLEASLQRRKKFAATKGRWSPAQSLVVAHTSRALHAAIEYRWVIGMRGQWQEG
jgi:hypothetical protein